MWTAENRPRYNRDRLRYPSDLTDEEWALAEPLIPPGKPGGGKRTVDMRAVVNSVMYILSTGCQWRYLPKDLPPRSTVHDYLSLWAWDGTLDRIHHALSRPGSAQPLDLQLHKPLRHIALVQQVGVGDLLKQRLKSDPVFGIVFVLSVDGWSQQPPAYRTRAR
jgi:transposase